MTCGHLSNGKASGNLERTSASHHMKAYPQTITAPEIPLGLLYEGVWKGYKIVTRIL
jgi:hypothetical protein